MLTVLGASHHDLELTQLERIASDPAAVGAGLVELVRGPDSPATGAVLLSTCNRLEIYLDARRFHDALAAATELIARSAGLAASDAGSLLRVRVGAPVAAHLFAVASGLDSMVVGEAEIAGQVSRALRSAQLERTASPALHQLFQIASRTSKNVTTVTGLGAAGRSIVSVALDIALGRTDTDRAPDGRLPQLRGPGLTRATIIGTGAYARVVAAELARRGVDDLSVYSPSGRAKAFAERHGAVPVEEGQLVDALAEADLVVTCSGSAAPALDERQLRAAVLRRRSPLPVIDLALRSDLTDDARGVPGVRVIDLHTVSRHADHTHVEAITGAQDLVAGAVTEFENHLAQRSIDPAVVALRQHIAGTVAKEMSRLRTKYPAEIADDLERSLHRVTQSLLHTPTLRAKELALNGDSAGYVQALHTVFGIDIADLAGGAPRRIGGATGLSRPEPQQGVGSVGSDDGPGSDR